MMTTLILAELGVAVVAWAVFIALSRGLWATSTGRQMGLAAAVGLVEAAALLTLGLGVHVPPLVFAVAFGAADVVVLRWVVLRMRSR